MSTELVLQHATSERWKELLDKFAEDAANKKREFRLPVEFVIEAVNGERWVMPAGTKVHLFAFITGAGATRHVFRTEGTFFMEDRDISICGAYPKRRVMSPKRKPHRPVRPRCVRITLHDQMPSLGLRSERMPLNLI